MSSTLRIICSRAPVAALHCKQPAIVRHLSTQRGAVTKLKRVFENYRVENYNHELPSRFRKDIVSAVDKDLDGRITLDDMNRLIVNIGAEDKISKTELELALREYENDQKFIPLEGINQLLASGNVQGPVCQLQ